MIKFDNLEKACIESGFIIMEADCNHLAVAKGVYNFHLYIHKEEVWNCIFLMSFNFLEPDIKATLLKAMAKDYEEYINGDD